MHCYNKMADVYDNLINADIDYSKYANTILTKCEKFNINMDDYLDLACGTGNLTYELCKDFKRCWAVDLSSEMLSVAEDKLRTKHFNTKFVCQDISDFQLNHKFDLITCCLDSTNYILDYEKLVSYFKSVYNHLSEEGIFIFDINSEYKLSQVLGENVYTYDDDDVVYIWENSLENNIVEMYLTFFIKDGHVYERFDEMHKERIYTHNEIEKALDSAGLGILEVLDNYEDKNITENTERIAYIINKKGV